MAVGSTVVPMAICPWGASSANINGIPKRVFFRFQSCISLVK